MTERLGRVSLGGLQGRSAAGGLMPRDTVNIVQSLGPSYNIGPFQGVDPADIITLSGQASITRYTSLQLLMTSTGGNGGIGYTVPAGRQLLIGMVMYSSTVAGARIVIGYGDTSVIDTVAAPTAANGLTSQALVGTTASTLYQFTVPPLKVPAAKIPYFFAATDITYVIVVGHLRNA